MTAIVERTPRTVTIRMSTWRWNRLQQMEKSAMRNKANKEKHKYRHETLCGMFNSDATQTELIEEHLKEKYKL